LFIETLSHTIKQTQQHVKTFGFKKSVPTLKTMILNYVTGRILSHDFTCVQ